ncbi:MAG: DUF3574 domain-containing protein [Saprospiraceae bacterium]
MARLFVIALFFISCASGKMVETNLYFGTSKPKGGVVSDPEWAQFKSEYVSQVFKEGSTQIAVIGNWYDPDKKAIIAEPTYELIYFYKKNKEISRQIDSLANRYKTKFDQQSVLRADKRVRAKF